jgi:hypothetical protein
VGSESELWVLGSLTDFGLVIAWKRSGLLGFRVSNPDGWFADTNGGLTNSDCRLPDPSSGLSDTYRRLSDANCRLAKTFHGLTDANSGLTDSGRGLADPDRGLPYPDHGLADPDGWLANSYVWFPYCHIGQSYWQTLSRTRSRIPRGMQAIRLSCCGSLRSSCAGRLV